MRVTPDELRAACTRALVGERVPPADADVVSDSVVFAQQSGRQSHGIVRLPIYLRKIREGLLDPTTPLSMIHETPATTALDAGNGFGQVASKRAIRLGTAKADSFGIGAVSVRRSNNFGVAGYFARMGAIEGSITLVFTNSPPAIAPVGGNAPIFGTNPIAIAFPRSEELEPIVLDMSSSVAARGKIRLAAKLGEDIPSDWAFNAAGLPTEDPQEAIDGTLRAIGGAKGVGLAMAVDVLSGVLSGAEFGGGVKALNHPGEPSNVGHLFLHISPTVACPTHVYNSRMEEFERRVRAAGAPGGVTLPGERGARNRDAARGLILLDDVSTQAFREIASQAHNG